MDKRDLITDIVIDERDIRGELIGLPALVLHYERAAAEANASHRAHQDTLNAIEASVRLETWDAQCAVEVLDAKVVRHPQVISVSNDEAVAAAALGVALANLESIRAKREALVVLASSGLYKGQFPTGLPSGPF